MTQKCGLVAIVGRPNVGKSTLINALLGQKVSITSRKAQTTRHRILGIDTDGDYQTIYVDTPGLHIEEKRAINRLMNRAASSSINDVEMVIFVVEGTHWNEDDEMVLKKFEYLKCPVILAVNKIDNVEDKELLLPHLKELGKRYNFKHILPMSAKKGDNIEKIREWSHEILPESEFYFPEDYITDRSSRFMASEIVREKLMRYLGDELPYSVTVEIEQFKQQANGMLNINALILVERDGQKRMVIGNKGEKIKAISTQSRLDMEELFDSKVFLEVWVKVKTGWSDDMRALHSLGYSDDYSK